MRVISISRHKDVGWILCERILRYCAEGSFEYIVSFVFVVQYLSVSRVSPAHKLAHTHAHAFDILPTFTVYIRHVNRAYCLREKLKIQFRWNATPTKQARPSLPSTPPPSLYNDNNINNNANAIAGMGTHNMCWRHPLSSKTNRQTLPNDNHNNFVAIKVFAVE